MVGKYRLSVLAEREPEPQEAAGLCTGEGHTLHGHHGGGGDAERDGAGRERRRRILVVLEVVVVVVILFGKGGINESIKLKT